MSRRAPRTRKAKIAVPIASMGDIAFLLIIFFILCSNFAKKAGKDIAPPTSPQLAELVKPRLYVAVDAEGRLYCQGRPVASADDVEAELAELIDPDAHADARTVIFECDHRVGKSVYEPLLEAIARAGGIIGAVGKENARPRGGG